MRIRAHFDGRAIVPDEPVELPVDKPLSVDIQVGSQAAVAAQGSPASDEERQAAVLRLMSRRVSGPPIPDEALRRENLYDDHRNRL